MAVRLRSTNISLLFDYGPELEETSLNELWQTFRRTAVEPGQASSTDLVSFADECLLCAQIATNYPIPTEEPEEDDNDVSSAHAQQGYTPDPHQTPSTQHSPPPTLGTRRVGLIYLHAGPANVPSNEASLGVIIKPDVRRRGYAREAVQLVLGWAFEELKFHRVQTTILDSPFRDRALRLFIGSGFVHEGTKRRAVYQPEGEGMAAIWKDVTYLGMLDTEWMLQLSWKRNNPGRERSVPTVWDEMFARHTREREELLKWEDKHTRVRKSSSAETLKEIVQNAAPDLAYLTDDASSISESSWQDSSSPSPGPNVVVTWDTDIEFEDASDTDDPHQQWEAVTRQHDIEGASLRPAPLDRILSLPSIPSTRLSESNAQSPFTIPSNSTPGSTPPSSPSLSSVPSSHASWMDSEDEDNWLPSQAPLLPSSPIQPVTPHDLRPRTSPAGMVFRSRSNSVSSSSAESADSWSDAQSSLGASSSTWDVVSDM